MCGDKPTIKQLINYEEFCSCGTQLVFNRSRHQGPARSRPFFWSLLQPATAGCAKRQSGRCGNELTDSQERRGLNEIAFGDWTGRHYDDLIDDELYRRFIKSPAKTLLPGGNDFRCAAARLERDPPSRAKVPGGRFLFISHGRRDSGDSLPLYELPLNEYRRLRVDNGLLSALQTDRRWTEIKYVSYLAEIILASKKPYMAAKAAALRK